MLKISMVCLYFAVLAVNFWNVNCTSNEEKKAIMEVMKPIAEECLSDCGLTEEDFKKHKGDHDMGPCFKKCLLQEMGVLDEAGKYNRDALHELIAEFADDKEKVKKFQDQLDSCFDTNGDNDGVDEASQMKRVDVLFKCFKEIKEAITDAQKSGIQRELVTVGIQCMKDHPLSLSDIRAFRNKMIPNGNDPKCFAACLFKKIGVMDNMGMISPSKARENAKKVLKGSDEHLKNVDEIMEKCSAVNQQKTNDGNKGCDRAKLAFGCFTENAPKINKYKYSKILERVWDMLSKLYGFDFDF